VNHQYGKKPTINIINMEVLKCLLLGEGRKGGKRRKKNAGKLSEGNPRSFLEKERYPGIIFKKNY